MELIFHVYKKRRSKFEVVKFYLYYYDVCLFYSFYQNRIVACLFIGVIELC